MKEQKPTPVSSFFGEMTFGLAEMRERLPQQAYKDYLRTLNNSRPLSAATAEAIAKVVHDWAATKGATHFCHWFQPMTGLTAEKHDAFISIQHVEHSELKVMERFSGSQLIQSEPDASSFPSGGTRSTFEARGYTAWDPRSPIFLIETEKSMTLCLPSIFFGYNGQALDYKTPLLRSVNALSKSCVKFLKVLGDVDVKRVSASLGVEQEYFLIDSEFAAKRPDLIMTGKTVLGAPSSKGQQLNDHYFGSIPVRVKNFMDDLETELYRLGIPAKTRHNEVAPCQFELAPIFEEASIAADHNTLMMETMKSIAKAHGFVCLFAEKPFAGLNGSGKHCNWSLTNDKGENLLEPGKTPHQNLRFLAFVAVVLAAVHKRSKALRASISSAGNDDRLGGHEAPPSIISAFLGSQLDAIYESIMQGEVAAATEAQIINLGITELPEILMDYSDRNRTSPFAFTGNKFEFRAVGSSANVAFPVTILNAAVCEALEAATIKLDNLVKSEKNRHAAVIKFIRETMLENKDIVFSGNNYSDQWVVEASKRGLPNLKNTIEALDTLKNAEDTSFLADFNILSTDEITTRYNILLENYVDSNLIEFSTLLEMVHAFVIPSIEKQLIQSYSVMNQAVGADFKKLQEARTKKMEGVMSALLRRHQKLTDIVEALMEDEDISNKSAHIAGKARKAALTLREASDEAETLVADDLWKLPRYREMLFSNVFK